MFLNSTQMTADICFIVGFHTGLISNHIEFHIQFDFRRKENSALNFEMFLDLCCQFGISSKLNVCDNGDDDDDDGKASWDSDDDYDYVLLMTTTNK